MIERIGVVVPAYNEEAYIARTLESLYNCQNPQIATDFIVVDNGSTDRTREVVESFSQEHEDFPLSIIEEPSKGTGVASNTGFRHAIDHLGDNVVARTDGDTSVAYSWLTSIEETFAENRNIQLATGPVQPLKDGWYKQRDRILWPLERNVARLIICGAVREFAPRLVLVPGHNMATRSGAYDETGGFPLTSIDSINEDSIYRTKIIEMFGVKSIEFVDGMVVNTSMRRMRHVGYMGIASYYLNRQDKQKREKASKGVIDIR